MPVICLLLWLAPIPVAIHESSEQRIKEQKINEICVQNYKNLDEVKQCKAILMRIDVPTRKDK